MSSHVAAEHKQSAKHTEKNFTDHSHELMGPLAKSSTTSRFGRNTLSHLLDFQAVHSAERPCVTSLSSL